MHALCPLGNPASPTIPMTLLPVGTCLEIVRAMVADVIGTGSVGVACTAAWKRS